MEACATRNAEVVQVAESPTDDFTGENLEDEILEQEINAALVDIDLASQQVGDTCLELPREKSPAKMLDPVLDFQDSAVGPKSHNLESATKQTHLPPGQKPCGLQNRGRGVRTNPPKLDSPPTQQHSLLTNPRRRSCSRTGLDTTAVQTGDTQDKRVPDAGIDRKQKHVLREIPSRRQQQKNQGDRTRQDLPQADYTDGNNTCLISNTSHVIENERHLFFLKELQKEQDSRSHRMINQGKVENTKLELVPETNSLVKKMFSKVAVALGVDTEQVEGDRLRKLDSLNSEAARRDIRIRLSMDDPNLSQIHKQAHQLFISGATLTDMRAAGVTITHLIEVGVKFDDWASRCDMGLRELAFMGGGWREALIMGFLPLHMKMSREKSGPGVLAAHPFNLAWEDLEDDLGMHVDEAIFKCNFTTADFAVFGETVSSLVARGLAPLHMAKMKEPPLNFEISLQASEDDIAFLFPHGYPDSTGGGSLHPCGHGEDEPLQRTKGNATSRGYVQRCKRRQQTGEARGAATLSRPIPATKKTGNFNNVKLV